MDVSLFETVVYIYNEPSSFYFFKPKTINYDTMFNFP